MFCSLTWLGHTINEECHLKDVVASRWEGRLHLRKQVGAGMDSSVVRSVSGRIPAASVLGWGCQALGSCPREGWPCYGCASVYSLSRYLPSAYSAGLW